jgi:prevent-host-death family protein
MIVNVHSAKTNLSKLLERAENGEEVIIARAGKPVVRLTPVVAAATGVEEKSAKFEHRTLPSWVGSLRGQIWIAPDIEEFEKELARQMEDNPIFPPDPT